MVINFTLVILLAALMGTGCDSKGTKVRTSSGVFFAPVPSAPDPITGEGSVEVVIDPFTDRPVNELTILKTINPGKLDSELESEQAETAVLGKLSDDELLLFERKSSTLLELNFVTGALKLPILKIGAKTVSLSDIFRTSAAKILVSITLKDPTGGQNHWVFGFETTSRSLFVMNHDRLTGELKVTVVANKVQIGKEIRESTFNLVNAFEIPRPSAAAQGPRQHEVLLNSTRQSLSGEHLYVLRENNGLVQGEFRLFDALGVLKPALDIPFIEDAFPYLDFDSLRVVTSSFDLDVFDFPGVALPLATENSFLIFDRVTNHFIKIQVLRNQVSQEITSRRIELYTFPDEILTAIRQGSASVDTEAVSFNFHDIFPHLSQPILLAFEEVTNSLMSIDYNAPYGRRIGLYSAASNVLQRIDLHGTDEEELGGVREPVLTFANADVRENRLLFDQGSKDLLSLNYLTGFYVVVLKQRDIGQQTGSVGSSNLTFMEPIDDYTLRAFDSQANALINIRVDYAAFPVSVTGRKKF
ncbi:MAG: hypothetical protein HY717_02020 [Planctomycetes bacterium]|nr:hypothetical protein [Planctomycetota bacterium]